MISKLYVRQLYSTSKNPQNLREIEILPIFPDCPIITQLIPIKSNFIIIVIIVAKIMHLRFQHFNLPHNNEKRKFLARIEIWVQL